MNEFKIKINRTLVQERKQGSYHRESSALEFVTSLPFVPFAGMKWVDKQKGINFTITNVTWSGDENAFLLSQSNNELTEDEVKEIIVTAREQGWKTI
ncbi:hypothetical protein A3844_01720 [Paenibacillus helianthi]|uniref:Uncharacterized protein n=1 Tax=Paenibacillus helianthi TaxID=1349432 RepID=A0ABX3EYP9_9BACL|nr:hypothetical protein [Paenibacillus helianthi]OKP91858.1 hypothetical protein A3844_01720 [Paenibacillus helianthi]